LETDALPIELLAFERNPNIETEEALFSSYLVNRVFSFCLAKFLQLNFGRASRNTDTRTVVSVLAIAALQPNILTLILFSLSHVAYLTINISGGPKLPGPPDIY
jgi:hypothetical protein